MNHRNIYDREFVALNNLVASLSVRISNLEQRNKEFDNMKYRKSNNYKNLSLKENMDNLQKLIDTKPIT